NPGPLMDRVSKLEQKVAAFAVGPSGLQPVVDKIKSLQQTEDGRKTLAAAVAALNSLTVATDPATLDTVLQQAPQQNTAVEQVRGDTPTAETRQVALLLAETQLRQSLETEAPAADAVALLQRLSDKDNAELSDALAKLAPDTAQGITPLPALSDQLAALAS